MARKQHKYHYLYKTTNLINGKFYIGVHSTSNLKDGYLGSGLVLRRSIRKYGEEKFKIEFLEFFDSKEKLFEKEKEVVNLNLIKDPLCMNLKQGGNGGFTKENSLKGTLAMNKKLWSDPDFVERKKKQGSIIFKKLHKQGKIKYDTFTGKTHSEDSKKKMSKKASERIGEKNSQFGTCWIYNNNESKKVKTEELNVYLSNGWIKGRKMQ